MLSAGGHEGAVGGHGNCLLTVMGSADASLSASPHPVASGLTRTIRARPPMVTFDSGQYAVPHTPLGQTVCVRANGVNDRSGGGEQIVTVYLGPVGPVEDAPTGGRGQPAASCEPT